MKRSNIHPLLLALAFSLSLFSCSGEEPGPGTLPAGPGSGEPINISISLTTEELGTRIALGPGASPADDTAIDDLWLLAYSADGGTLFDANYVVPLRTDGGGYSVVAQLNIPEGTTQCVIYSVANTNNNILFEPSGDTSAFNTVAKLKTFAMPLAAATAETDMWAYTPAGASEPRPSLLKRGVGRVAGTAAPGRDADAPVITLTGNTAIAIALYLLPARIDFTCTNEYAWVTVKSVQLKNVPDRLTYFRKSTDTSAQTYIDYKADQVTIAPNSSRSFVWYLPSHVRASHTTASPETSTYIEVIATTAAGTNIEVKYHFYPHTKTGSTYNFNLASASSYPYTGYMVNAKYTSLATNKHWNTPVVADLASDANCMIVRSDANLGSLCGYRFDIAPQINKYGSYLATQSLAASSVSATHATRVIAANAEWTAEIVWQTAPNLITLVDKTGKGPTGNIAFSVSGSQGNALIAVRDNTTNKIVWSWHLWVLNHDPGTRSYTPVNSDITQKNKRYTLLNYNLGAWTNQLGSGLAAYGLLYQWGRKDPFLNGETASSDISTLYFKGDGSGYTWPATSSVADLDASVANPGVFIIRNWRGSATLGTASVPTNLSWGGHNGGSDYTIATYGSYQSADKTVFDPCPAGYRVPPIAAFDKALDDAYNKQAGNFNAGFDWSTYYNLTSYTATGPGIFSAGGFRNEDTGALFAQGTFGFYWSASLYNVTNGCCLGLSSGNASPRNYNTRANGYGVRCVRL